MPRTYISHIIPKLLKNCPINNQETHPFLFQLNLLNFRMCANFFNFFHVLLPHKGIFSCEKILDVGQNFEQSNFKMVDVSYLKINKRSNVERLILRE